MILSFLGYAETYSILKRKSNQGLLSPATFQAAKSLLRTEIISGSDFGLLDFDKAVILAGIALIERHNINASDASILAAYLQFAGSGSLSVAAYILVSSDLRFLRAAQTEGISVLNPETFAAADVASFLATR